MQRHFFAVGAARARRGEPGVEATCRCHAPDRTARGINILCSRSKQPMALPLLGLSTQTDPLVRICQVVTYESALGGDYSPEQWSAFGSTVQAAATVLTLLVAVAAAIYAKRQVREARAQVEEARKTREADAERAAALREEQARPFCRRRLKTDPVSPSES